jgi:hypothetical protein
MMTCKELAELLMDYCDGALPKEYCDLICQHMRGCATCQAYCETYQITVKICRDLPCPPLPDHVAEKLRAALKDIC